MLDQFETGSYQSLMISEKEPIGKSRPVILSANSFWNVANFRAQLINALVAQGHPLLILAPNADAGWAGAHGAEAMDIAIDRSGLNPLTDARLIFRYLNIFRSRRPALFLSFTAKPNIYGSLAGRLAGVPCLPNVSGLGTAFIGGGPLSWLMRQLYRLAFRTCPLVFFQNPDDRDLFVAGKIITPAQAVLLPGSGVDLAWFAPMPRPAKDRGLRFLFVGRLLGDKGVREFADAARLLRSKHPDWRFQLLGQLDPANRSGIADKELRQWIDEGLVEHLGQADDVRPHIAASTAVVLPSYREGLPRSLLEAAAMARPLIATDVPGNRELVRQGSTGLLCEPRNAQSLASAMARLGAMPEGEREAMGRAARALVEREYDVRLVVEAYLRALKQPARRARV